MCVCVCVCKKKRLKYKKNKINKKTTTIATEKTLAI